jgi:hypothetical protein
MDDELRNGLWNAVHNAFFESHLHWGSGVQLMDGTLREFSKQLIAEVLKQPIDSLHLLWTVRLKDIRTYFMSAPWNRVYEFVEYVANHPRPEDSPRVEKFLLECNRILEREMSAYRFIGTHLARVTDSIELQAIGEARDLPARLSVVQYHVDAAAAHLSSRDHPDYRNSIKESISAVESMCSLVAGQEKADLDAALRTLEGQLALHPALKRAFKQLYGYTSDSSGIRHALLDEPNLTFEDAKFMLVACSAFINFLKARIAA